MHARLERRRSAIRSKRLAPKLEALCDQLRALCWQLGYLNEILETDVATSLQWECIDLLDDLVEANHRGHLGRHTVARVLAFSERAKDWQKTYCEELPTIKATARCLERR